MIKNVCERINDFSSWIASICLSCIILVVFFTNYLFIFFSEKDFLLNIFKVGSCALIGIMFLIAFFHQKKYNSKIFIFFIIAILVVILNFLLFPHLKDIFMETSLVFFFSCSIPFALILLIHNFDVLYICLKKVSVIVSICSLIPVIMVVLGQMSLFGEKLQYFMGYGYSCLVPALILFFEFWKGKKIIHLALFCFLLVSIILLGSRGPLFPIGLYVLYTVLNESFVFLKGVKKLTMKSTLLLAVSFFVMLFLIVLSDSLFSSLSSFLSVNNISSRTINVLLDGDFTKLSGRESIYSVLLSEIENDFIAVRGINAEYLIIGIYAHNIVVEILYQFGCVLGGALLCLLLLCILRTLSALNSTAKELAVIFMISSICQLWNSGTLWTNHLFWVWIALSFCLTKALPREVKE